MVTTVRIVIRGFAITRSYLTHVVTSAEQFAPTFGRPTT
jgi:hypothetical protein